MSKFSTRFKELRLESHLSQQGLSEKTGISKSSINMYERGEREPGIETLERFADFFGVNMDYLIGKSAYRCAHLALSTQSRRGNDLTATPGVFMPNMKKVPMLGKIACGEPIYSPDFDDGYALLSDGMFADFALEAKGDSMMNAHILDGDMVFFAAQDMVDNGQIAAVVVGEEVTLKRVFYYRDKNKLILQPDNPAYEPLVYTGEELDSIRIIGRAVAHLRRL